MDSLSKALADLRVQDRPNITATAKKHGLSRSKLSRHWNGVSQTKNLAYENHRLLTTVQSKVLIKYINDLTERGLPPTNGMVRNFAATIAQKQPGPHWTSRWLEVNKDSLLTGYLTTIDAVWKKADLAFYYGLYVTGRMRSDRSSRVHCMANCNYGGNGSRALIVAAQAAAQLN